MGVVGGGGVSRLWYFWPTELVAVGEICRNPEFTLQGHLLSSHQWTLTNWDIVSFICGLALCDGGYRAATTTAHLTGGYISYVHS